MTTLSQPSDPDWMRMFGIYRTNSSVRFDSRLRFSSELPGIASPYQYHLIDRSLLGKEFDNAIFTLAIRRAGGIITSYANSRFATETAIQGKSEVFCLGTILHGSMTLIRGREWSTGTANLGIIHRFDSSMRMVTSDECVRNNVFVHVAQVEEWLEHALDNRLRTPLEFQPSLDWSCGLAASLKFQLDFVRREFERPDGIASNAVALASLTDLLISLVLRAAPHNYSDQLDLPVGTVVPMYVRRAEDFMRAQCTTPIRLFDIASAAGCSVRTLGAVFQRFRGLTPLAALHACRLEQIYAELSRSAADAPIGAVARRYGFTNSSRFTTAFARRFGQKPMDVVRRASRL